MAKKHSDQELMQFHDGELPSNEHDELAAELLEGPDAASREAAQAKLRSLEQMGDVVRGYLDLEAESAAPKLAGLWARVEQGIQANETREPATAPARPARRRTHEAAQGRGVWGAFNGWLDRYRSNVVTSLVTAGAVAALFLAFSPERQGLREQDSSAVAEPPRAPHPRADALARSMPPMVESLEVEDGSADILTLPAEAGDTATAVIWVTRRGAEPGSPI